MSIPAGGALAALTLPFLLAHVQLPQIFVILGAVWALPTVAILVWLGPAPLALGATARPRGSQLGDRRLWLLALSASLVVFGQITVAGMSASGFAYTAAAEIAHPERTGSALGFQNLVFFVLGALAPILFGTAVTLVGWTLAFAGLPLMVGVACLLFTPLVRAEAAGWRLGSALEG
jgi:hypothetical protein